MFSTELWQQETEKIDNDRERLRISTLIVVKRALEVLSQQYKFQEAWIFGSVTRPYNYSPASDIDIGLEGLDKFQLYAFVGAIQDSLDRSVDVVRLEETRLAAKIKKEGILWKPEGK